MLLDIRSLICILLCISPLYATLDTTWRNAKATWYNATGQGACSFSDYDSLVAAINTSDYAKSLACGTPIEVKGPHGTVLVTVTDLCPGCEKNDLDLSKQAFTKIARLSQGRVHIQWRFTTKEINKPIEYYFKKSSSRWWLAVQIRNTPTPVQGVEIISKNGTRVKLTRSTYNYFIGKNVGDGPFVFILGDSTESVVIDSGIVLMPGKTVSSTLSLAAAQLKTQKQQFSLLNRDDSSNDDNYSPENFLPGPFRIDRSSTLYRNSWEKDFLVTP